MASVMFVYATGNYLNTSLAKVQAIIGFDKVWDRGEGAYLWDFVGDRYLDLLSGYSVFNLGRGHPVVKKAMQDALAMERPNLVRMDCPLLAGLLAEELVKRRGELLLMQEEQTETGAGLHQAERCFERAIEVARRQKAKSWELRATTSLARLWQAQGRADEAREALAKIYDCFTEGFDTRDLREAKALLEKLS
jgi:acetylornithine/succinyldiaminopimelate/putrescine aminotransferase